MTKEERHSYWKEYLDKTFCSADEETGNRPCDNGCPCDMCSYAPLDKSFERFLIFKGLPASEVYEDLSEKAVEYLDLLIDDWVGTKKLSDIPDCDFGSFYGEVKNESPCRGSHYYFKGKLLAITFDYRNYVLISDSLDKDATDAICYLMRMANRKRDLKKEEKIRKSYGRNI